MPRLDSTELARLITDASQPRLRAALGSLVEEVDGYRNRTPTHGDSDEDVRQMEAVAYAMDDILATLERTLRCPYAPELAELGPDQ